MPVGPSIEHEINVRAPASKVHDAIATHAGLQGWNTSRVTGDRAVGSEWILSYVGGPDFVWRVDRDGTGKEGFSIVLHYDDTALQGVLK